MIEKINNIKELERIIEVNKREIQPIKDMIHEQSHLLELSKRSIVEKYVQLEHKYILNEMVKIHQEEIYAFEIVSAIFYASSETFIYHDSNYEKYSPSYLGYSDIYKLFMETNEYQKIIRENNLKSIYR